MCAPSASTVLDRLVTAQQAFNRCFHVVDCKQVRRKDVTQQDVESAFFELTQASQTVAFYHAVGRLHPYECKVEHTYKQL